MRASARAVLLSHVLLPSSCLRTKGIMVIRDRDSYMGYAVMVVYAQHAFLRNVHARMHAAHAWICVCAPHAAFLPARPASPTHPPTSTSSSSRMRRRGCSML